MLTSQDFVNYTTHNIWHSNVYPPDQLVAKRLIYRFGQNRMFLIEKIKYNDIRGSKALIYIYIYIGISPNCVAIEKVSNIK